MSAALVARREKLAARMLHADTWGNNHLANGNAALEGGKKAQAEAFFAKGQHWLDQSNAAREKIAAIDAALSKAAPSPDLTP